jgi:tRNA A37 N6-isopentenylltransferase MiaA
MKVPKWIQGLVQDHIKAEIKHIDEATTQELDKHEHQMEKNANEVRKKSGLKPTEGNKKESPEREALKARIAELERKLQSLSNTQALTTDEIFADILKGNKTLDEALAEIR